MLKAIRAPPALGASVVCHLLSVLEVSSSLCELPTDIRGVMGGHSAAEQTAASRGARITLCSSHGRPAHFSVNWGL